MVNLTSVVKRRGSGRQISNIQKMIPFFLCMYFILFPRKSYSFLTRLLLFIKYYQFMSSFSSPCDLSESKFLMHMMLITKILFTICSTSEQGQWIQKFLIFLILAPVTRVKVQKYQISQKFFI